MRVEGSRGLLRSSSWNRSRGLPGGPAAGGAGVDRTGNVQDLRCAASGVMLRTESTGGMVWLAHAVRTRLDVPHGPECPEPYRSETRCRERPCGVCEQGGWPA